MNEREKMEYTGGPRHAVQPVKRFVAHCYEWLEALISSLIVVVLLFTLLFRIVNVSGPSMLPTLQSNDRVLLTSYFYQPKGCGGNHPYGKAPGADHQACDRLGKPDGGHRL